MVVGDTLLEEAGEVASEHGLVCLRNREGRFDGESGRDLLCHFFRFAAARSENQKRTEASKNSASSDPRPVAVNVGRDARKILDRKIIQWDWTISDLDEVNPAAESAQPFDDLGGIANAPAEKKESCRCGREGHRHLVVQSPVGVGDHLVFVENKETRSMPREDPLALGL